MYTLADHDTPLTIKAQLKSREYYHSTNNRSKEMTSAEMKQWRKTLERFKSKLYTCT